MLRRSDELYKTEGLVNAVFMVDARSDVDTESREKSEISRIQQILGKRSFPMVKRYIISFDADFRDPLLNNRGASSPERGQAG